MSVFSPDSRVTIVFDCATDTGFVFASLGSSPPKMLNELNNSCKYSSTLLE